MEMIVNPLVTKSELMFSDSEKINIKQIQEAIEVTNEVIWKQVTHCDSPEYPINTIKTMNKAAVGGSYMTDTVTKMLEKYHPSLVKNPSQKGYPDMLSVKDSSTGVELKSGAWRDGRNKKRGIAILTNHVGSNNILFLGWDYLYTIPQFIGIWYANNMVDDDWLVTGVEKTTSFEGKTQKRPSVRLNKYGKEKIEQSWLMIHPAYQFNLA